VLYRREALNGTAVTAWERRTEIEVIFKGCKLFTLTERTQKRGFHDPVSKAILPVHTVRVDVNSINYLIVGVGYIKEDLGV